MLTERTAQQNRSAMAANKWDQCSLSLQNGLPAEATRDDKTGLSLYRLGHYQAQNWSGTLLSEYFVDDFSSLSTRYLAAVDSDARRNLRDLLRTRKFNVSKGRNIEVAPSLYNVVNDDLS